MGRYALGAVCMAFLPMGSAEASARARDLGFDHFDPMLGDDPASLALPVGIPISFEPKPGWCLSPAPTAGEGQWERAVEQWRAAPGCLLEPYPNSCVNSLAAMRAMGAPPGDIDRLLAESLTAFHGIVPFDLATIMELRGDSLEVRVASGSLASWFASTLLMWTAAGAVLTFLIRRHRTDDYRGSYYVWLWATIALVLASIAASRKRMTNCFRLPLRTITRPTAPIKKAMNARSNAAVSAGGTEGQK